MTTAADPLNDFAAARVQAHRFHRASIGDVDPRHCLADFLWRIKSGDRKGLETVYKAAMNAESGTQGGYLVPTQLREELFATVEEEAIVRPRALVVPMTTQVVQLPIPDTTTAQSATIPPYFGGVDLQWTQDAASRSESEPTWRQVELRAWDLSAIAKASNPLLADATGGFDAFLRKLLARAIAWTEDYAFLRGNGAGKPQGMAGCAGRKTRTRSTSSHFKFADAAAMVALLLPSSWARAIWVMHPLTLDDLISLATTTTAAWQSNQPREPGVGPVGALHTMPVYVSGSLPPLGTEADVILVDPSLYAIGDRSTEVAIGADEPTAFLANQSVFRILHRVAGRPWLDAPVTLADGTNTVSPYITLV